MFFLCVTLFSFKNIYLLESCSRIKLLFCVLVIKCRLFLTRCERTMFRIYFVLDKVNRHLLSQKFSLRNSISELFSQFRCLFPPLHLIHSFSHKIYILIIKRFNIFIQFFFWFFFTICYRDKKNIV